eukprot:8274063-Alexandrium_andersonii.AAC.1
MLGIEWVVHIPRLHRERNHPRTALITNAPLRCSAPTQPVSTSGKGRVLAPWRLSHPQPTIVEKLGKLPEVE